MSSDNEKSIASFAIDVARLRSDAQKLRQRLSEAVSEKEKLEQALHAIDVHETELETQNEQLRQYQIELQRSEKRARDLFELAPVGYVVLDEHGAIRDINLTGTDLLGVVRKKLLGRPMIPWVAPESRDAFFAHLRDVFEATHGRAQIDLLNGDGERISTEFQSVRVKGRYSHHTECRTTIRDISERVESDRRRQLAEAVIDNMSSGLLVTDSEHKIVSLNSAFTEITGYAADEVLQKEADFLMPEHQNAPSIAEAWRRVREEGKWEGEVWTQLKDGTSAPQWMTLSAIKNLHGGITNYVALYSDVTKQENIQERLYYLAYYDVLTGLPNRKLFMDRLAMEHSHARRDGRTYAVLFTDVDGFKNINDTYGHADADAVLREISSRLRCNVREMDTVARLAGDEFVVMLDDLDSGDQAERIAEKLRAAVMEPVTVGQRALSVSVSIGISLFPQHGDNAENLLARADTAMYQAKREGRNRVRVYSDELEGSLASQDQENAAEQKNNKDT